MLKTFRNASNSIATKIIFSAIILSFALWGVGDIVKNYSGSRSVIKVGKKSITADNFAFAFRKEQQEIRNKFGANFKEDIFKGLDLINMVAEKMISEAVVEQSIIQRNITVSKASIMRIIQSTPEFAVGGKFSIKIFQDLLRKAGIAESGYIEHIRQAFLRSQLIHPLSAGYFVPEFITKLTMDDFATTKTISILKLKADDVKLDNVIKRERVIQYFDNNKDKYKTPEKRDFSLLVLDFQSLGNKLKITESEIEEYYKSNKESYIPQETRSFKRFSFNSIEEAKRALSVINSRTNIKEIEKGLNIKSTDLIDMEKNDFPTNIRDNLFSLKRNDVSNIFATGSTFSVYMLESINKTKERDIKDIRKEIKDILISEKMNSVEFAEQIKSKRNFIDDSFGAGRPMEEIAKDAGMSLLKFSGLDREGAKAELEKINTDEKTKQEIMNAVFSLDINLDSGNIDAKENDLSSFIVRVDKIVSESLPKIDTIFNQVERDYILSQKIEKLRKKIYNIEEQGRESSKEVLKMKGNKKYTIAKQDLFISSEKQPADVKKLLKDFPYQQSIMVALSSLSKGETMHFDGERGEYYVISVIDEKTGRKIDEDLQEKFLQFFEKSRTEDVHEMIMSAFRKEMKVDFNKELASSLVKTSEDSEDENL